MIDVTSQAYLDAVGAATPLVPHREAVATDPLMLIFTSGTSGDPKAVPFAHVMAVLSGSSLVLQLDVTPADVCYLSMPLFHSNGVAGGWSVAVCSGATMVPAKFSASGFLNDIRRYGATYMNYVGKPLALVLGTQEQPDDADNPLRVAFGNEAADRDIERFARRFGCRVMDGFGSSEFAVIVVREDGTPPGSIGKGWDGVAIYHADTVTECATAVFDETGALANFDEAVGELVNTTGGGAFGGYYNDPDATNERMRHGMYWSGDLAYRDADGWIYLAGRTADWMRVDGENLAAAPIERILLRLPQLSQVAVYAVPDPRVGDQVMAAVVLKDDAELDADRVGILPVRAAGPVAEGLAAVRTHQRRPAADGHQQDPQARAHQGRGDRRRGSAVGTARPGTLVCGRPGCASVGVGVITEPVGPPNFPSQSTERCRGTGRPGSFRDWPAFPPSGQTGTGIRAAAADAVISCRSAVKSEIVLVATVATGRASRPVASFFDTITTLSM